MNSNNAANDIQPGEQENKVAKRNAIVYATCQAFNGASTPVNLAVGGLAGSYLLGEDKSLATIPIASFTAGVAIGAIPAAVLTRNLGCKYGFMVGMCIGIVGMLLATYALLIGSFMLLCVATLINGVAAGFVQQYRFAAADRGTAEFVPKAISCVLIGGIAAAVIGPQLVIHTRDLLLPTQFAGAYLSGISLFVVSIMAMYFLDSSTPVEQNTSTSELTVRPLLQIIVQPRFLVALLCGTCSFALMTFIMTAAPLAMVGHRISVDDATLGIQWHVMAMFGPSFFTGNLIARYGKAPVVICGLCILVACGIVALMGIQLWHFWLSLVLLGLGWNFAFIGSTAMVVETYHPHEKSKAQGAHDFILFSVVALASLLAGWVLNHYGWETLNYIIFPVVIIAILALFWLSRLERVETA